MAKTCMPKRTDRALLAETLWVILYNDILLGDYEYFLIVTRNGNMYDVLGMRL